MSPESFLPILSLAFMWLLTAVFAIALQLFSMRFGYSYLKFGVAALLVELARQTTNNLLTVWPIPPLYYLSTLFLYVSAALTLQMVASADSNSTHNRLQLVSGLVFVACLTGTFFTFDPYSRWSWYLSYAPTLAVHAFIIFFAARLLGRELPATSWLLAASVFSLITRAMMPALSADVTAVLGFVYFIDGLLFSLMVATMALVALEQLSAEYRDGLERQRRTTEELRFLLDNTEDVILSHDANGVLLSWNDRAASLFGYSEADAIGLLEIDQLLLPGNENKGGQRNEYTAYSKSGRRVPVDVARRHAIHQARITWTLVIRDKSIQHEIELQKRELSRQQRQIQKLESLGVFAAGIAHDFNSLLGGIQGHAERALTQSGLVPAARNSLDHIVTASQRASELTDHLLTYAGQGDFRPALMDLNESIQQIVGLMRASISPGAKVRLELMPGGAWINADRIQITQILINLITNASEALAGNEGGITLTTTRRGDGILLLVNDTGQGMSDTVLARVFEPFFSTKLTGRGLGLASVAGIIDNHDAQVEVESAPGQGTTFTFTFPMAGSSDVSMPQPPPESTTVDTPACSIVMIGQDQDLKGLCIRILSSAGHSTTGSFGDGEQALQMLQDPTVDLVVMDCQGKTGEDAAFYRQWIEAGIDKPMVLIAGPELSNVMEGIDANARVTVIRKPFLADELIDAVDQAIARERPG